jgi:hypothetical protein
MSRNHALIAAMVLIWLLQGVLVYYNAASFVAQATTGGWQGIGAVALDLIFGIPLGAVGIYVGIKTLQSKPRPLLKAAAWSILVSSIIIVSLFGPLIVGKGIARLWLLDT